jgi:hypothetical protein
MRCVVLCKQYVCPCVAFRGHLLLIIRLPVMLNDHTMYEHILEDDIFFGVVGMLECE